MYEFEIIKEVGNAVLNRMQIINTEEMNKRFKEYVNFLMFKNCSQQVL